MLKKKKKKKKRPKADSFRKKRNCLLFMYLFSPAREEETYNALV